MSNLGIGFKRLDSVLQDKVNNYEKNDKTRKITCNSKRRESGRIQEDNECVKQKGNRVSKHDKQRK